MERHSKVIAPFHARSPEGHAFLTAFGTLQKQLEVENRLDFAGLDWTELTRWEAGGSARPEMGGPCRPGTTGAAGGADARLH